jgi:hypothetical protein
LGVSLLHYFYVKRNIWLGNRVRLYVIISRRKIGRISTAILHAGNGATTND